MELTTLVAATPVAIKAESATRVHLAYLDNLRILLTSLVILHHFAITNGAAGDFYGLEGTHASLLATALLTMFTAVNQSFFMGFFFLISAYLTPRSYDRKGAGSYLGDRIIRLGIPLIVFASVVNPVVSFMVAPLHGFRGSFWQFLTERTGAAIGVGPLWFVETLLLFALGYALFRQLTRPASIPSDRPAMLKAPSNRVIALFAIALGLVTFVVRIWFPVGFWLEPLHLQIADFPQYLALLCVGVLAYRNNWLEQLSDAQARPWRWVALAMIPTFIVAAIAGGLVQGHLEPFSGGLYWQAFACALWEQIMGISMIMSFLLWFRGRLNRQGAFARSLSDATYAAYVLQVGVLVPLALALRSVPLDGGFKFLVIAPVALSAAFALGMLVKRLPLAGQIL